MRFTSHRLLLAGLAAAAIVAVHACGSSSSTPSSPTSSAPPPSGGSGPSVTITISGMNGANSFSPNPGMLTAGQTVAWRNVDTIAHTATSNTDAFDTGAIAPGSTSAPVTMPTAGSYPYHCSFHPTMTGSLTVAASTGGGY